MPVLAATRNRTLISVVSLTVCAVLLLANYVKRNVNITWKTAGAMAAASGSSEQQSDGASATNVRLVHANCSLAPYARQLQTDDNRQHAYYYSHYQPFVCPFKLRNQPFTLIEIGRGYGGGVYLWRAYFPTATIVSLDIQDWHSTLPYAQPTDRVHVVKGNQADRSVIDSLCARYSDIDVVIDDGSHHNEHVAKTLQMLFPCLRDKGVYAIEDTQTSYWYRYGGSCDPHNGRTTVNYLKSLMDQQNHAEIEQPNGFYDANGPLSGLLAEMHVYHNLAILVKGDNRHASSGDPALGDIHCRRPANAT